jgi:Leishmanolysin
MSFSMLRSKFSKTVAFFLLAVPWWASAGATADSFASNGKGNIRRAADEKPKHDRFSPFSPNFKIDFSHRHLDYGDDDVDNKIERDLQFVSGDRPFEPIRIKYDLRVIDSRRGESTELDAKIDAVLNNTLPAAAEKWAQHLSVRPVRSAFVVGQLDCQGQYASYLPDDVTYSDADLVIIVGGDPEGYCGDGTLAYAFPCSLDQTDRPIVGVINFCLNEPVTDGYLVGLLPTIPGVDLTSFYSTWTGATLRADHLRLSQLEVTLHELTHVLGFSTNLLPLFRDESGVPYTDRQIGGAPVESVRQCVNGTNVTDMNPSEATVQLKQLSDGRFEQYIVTPRVQTIARNHFNCQTLLGGRLQEDENCFGSHWHERHHFSDLLGPVVNAGSANSLSLLTLALLDDTGWYQVDYRGGVQPAFGIGAGCGFVTEACINATDQVPEWAENEFCATPLRLQGGIPETDSLNSVICDPSYQSWAICDLSDLRSVTTTDRTYFSDPSLMPIYFSYADNCPIPDFSLGLDCRIADPYNVFYPGESVGNNSRCINAFYESNTGRAYQPACIQVTCDTDAGVVRIGQGEFEQNCTYDGELLPVSGKAGASFVCPRLAAVCPEIFACPDGCFGRGECIRTVDGSSPPVCKCFNETNTDKSCAPPYITEQASNTPSPGLDQPATTPVPSVAPTVRPFPSTAVVQATNAPVAQSPTTPPTQVRPSLPPTAGQLETQTGSPGVQATEPSTSTTAGGPPTTSGVQLHRWSLYLIQSVSALLLWFGCECS